MKWSESFLCGRVEGGTVFKENCRYLKQKKCSVSAIFLKDNIISYEKNNEHLILSLFGRNMKRRVQVLCSCIYCGSVLQKQHHDISVAKTGSYMQWCLFFLFKYAEE